MIQDSIIKNCIANKRDAFKALYEGTIAYCYAVVKRYVPEYEVRDMIQEIYAEVFTSLKRYDAAKGDFKFFFRGIIVNRCLMLNRKNKRLPLFSSMDETNIEIKDESDQKIESLTKADISKLLEDMPAGYKTIFLLFVIDEFTHNEIAILLSISPETSRSQYMRAKKWILTHSIISKNTSTYGLF